jgi:hypothetical protein
MASWQPGTAALQRRRRSGARASKSRLGSRDSALIREVRRRLRARPLEYDERGFPIESPLTMAERPRRLAAGRRDVRAKLR